MNWLNVNSGCKIPASLQEVTCIGKEQRANKRGIKRQQINEIWQLAEQLYRTGTHPAIQLCIRHNGRRVLHRGIGHASGNGPGDPGDGTQVPITLDTPINLFSASKAISAMVVHKLDEENVLRIDDRVCDYIPEFSGGGKQRITLRHVLALTGFPLLPPLKQLLQRALGFKMNEVVELSNSPGFLTGIIPAAKNGAPCNGRAELLGAGSHPWIPRPLQPRVHAR